MKRVLSLLLSLLLMTPIFATAENTTPPPLTTDEVMAILFDEVVEILSGNKPGLDIALTSPEGEAVSAAFGLTENGFSATVTHADCTLGINEESAFFADDAGAVSSPLQALLAVLLGGDSAAALPIPTEAELNALAAIGQELSTTLLGGGSLSWSLSNHMLSLHIDLDKLIAQLDAALPEALNRHAAQHWPGAGCGAV